MDFLPVYKLSVVLWTQPWGKGWGGYMSSLILGRLHEFGRFISIACSSTRAQLHTFLCLAQLHASSPCIDCISSVFSAEGATRKLILQSLPTIGYLHAFYFLPIFPRQSIYGVAGVFFLNLVTFDSWYAETLFFVSVVAVDQLLLEKLRRS